MHLGTYDVRWRMLYKFDMNARTILIKKYTIVIATSSKIKVTPRNFRKISRFKNIKWVSHFSLAFQDLKLLSLFFRIQFIMKILVISMFFSLPIIILSYRMPNTSCWNCEKQATKWYVILLNEKIRKYDYYLFQNFYDIT